MRTCDGRISWWGYAALETLFHLFSYKSKTLFGRTMIMATNYTSIIELISFKEFMQCGWMVKLSGRCVCCVHSSLSWLKPLHLLELYSSSQNLLSNQKINIRKGAQEGSKLKRLFQTN